MLLKKLFMVCCVLLVAVTSNAQNRQKLDIESVTVFLNGAELYSTTKLNVPAGESEFLLTNVAGNVNQQSLNVGAASGVVVQFATFQNNFLQNDDLSPRAREIQDSIEHITNRRKGVQNEIQTIDEQINIIKQNRQVGGANAGLSTDELAKMLDLVKNRMAKLLDQKDELSVGIRDTDELLRKLRQQLQEEKNKGFQPGGQLLVKLYSKKATTTDIKVSYVVSNAGWTPTYDIRVDEVGGPVQLAYKAHVYQNSGVAWNKVKLTLSTGNPNEGAQAPTLNPWYLAFYRPRPISYQNKAYNNGTGDQLEKMPSRNTSSIASTSAGAYSAKDEENVPIGGGRGDGTLYIIDGVQVVGNRGVNIPQAAIGDYVATDNQGVNTMFDIELPYTIPSDGKQHNVAVKTAQLPAIYRYYAVPKLDRDAFLQAQITGWEDLDLLPAHTNIFYEGTYVGQGYIDVRNVKDTMNLSLGRDKKVVIRRERDKELRSVRTIGSNVKETFVYKITVRNTRNKTVDLVLMDQLPISNDKDIEIDDKIYDGATYNETTGAVTWKLQLAPNETKEVKVGFTAKYPKGKQINL